MSLSSIVGMVDSHGACGSTTSLWQATVLVVLPVTPFVIFHGDRQYLSHQRLMDSILYRIHWLLLPVSQVRPSEHKYLHFQCWQGSCCVHVPRSQKDVEKTTRSYGTFGGYCRYFSWPAFDSREFRPSHDEVAMCHQIGTFPMQGKRLSYNYKWFCFYKFSAGL